MSLALQANISTPPAQFAAKVSSKFRGLSSHHSRNHLTNSQPGFLQHQTTPHHPPKHREGISVYPIRFLKYTSGVRYCAIRRP